MIFILIGHRQHTRPHIRHGLLVVRQRLRLGAAYAATTARTLRGARHLHHRHRDLRPRCHPFHAALPGRGQRRQPVWDGRPEKTGKTAGVPHLYASPPLISICRPRSSSSTCPSSRARRSLTLVRSASMRSRRASIRSMRPFKAGVHPPLQTCQCDAHADNGP